MVWFTDFKDVFKKCDKDSLFALVKERDIAAAKADAVAKTRASDLQTEAPRPQPVKDDFRANNPSMQLRQIVK